MLTTIKFMVVFFFIWILYCIFALLIKIRTNKK
nr:MAG TPA: Oxaloacetate decarboxylase, gamma chain [Bacteriophage sp.]DAU61818.1 MAG TPA: Oxaloacetate decarboxylase, gamma chain [Bacteriophage sp.]